MPRPTQTPSRSTQTLSTPSRRIDSIAKTEPQAGQSRRQVLGTLSAAGLIGSSAIGAAVPAAAADKPLPGDELEYRETDHIRRYYESARR
jgi:hypothetical protein